MEFNLPEVYDASQRNLSHAKDAFLDQYCNLVQQKLLHCLTLEFKALPQLQEVVFITVDEGKGVDTELKFSDGFDPDEDENYWDAKNIENSLMAEYVPELAEFCESRCIKRSDIFNDDGTPRYPDTRSLLTAIMSN